MASVGEPTHSKRPHAVTERLKEFLNTPSPTKQKSCPVPGCSKVLSSDPGLRYHIQAHHTDHRDFVCNSCHRTFKSSNGLKYHLKKRAGRCQENVMEIPENEVNVDQNRVKSVPEPLDLIGDTSTSILPSFSNMNQNEADSRLIEFAKIATSPQSPLMQSAPPKVWEKNPAVRHIKFPEKASSTTVASQTSRDDNGNYCDDGSDPKVTSSSPFSGGLSQNSNLEETWSHSWPKAVWQCFIKDTRIHFVDSSDRQEVETSQWLTVENLAKQETIATQAAGSDRKLNQSYGCNGLRLCVINKMTEEVDTKRLHLLFSPDIVGQPSLWADCTEDHPFFVKDKGWSSCNPLLTHDNFGIPSNVLEENDLCLPPDHPKACLSDEVFHTSKRYDLTPQDQSAVFALSHMAKQKRDSDSTSSPHSGSGSPTKKRPIKEEEGKKPKRPMNAFLLFAQRHRLNLTQDYPGKDNRAISIILGDKWKNMKEEEKMVYEEEARVLAEKQKQKHPNCWKRKK
ncbi:HMG box-containing protein 1-like [Saccostrea echinata]|uniref:HMG box-containing protein 1-like n=1 Tax=Saccostrea echinata TaxID=191078 RepID=UPI002A81B644|nr:HMG box-containing protein 1-like [Saccostrea echinata]